MLSFHLLLRLGEESMNDTLENPHFFPSAKQATNMNLKQTLTFFRVRHTISPKLTLNDAAMKSEAKNEAQPYLHCYTTLQFTVVLFIIDFENG